MLMAEITTLPVRRRDPGHRIALVAVLVVAFVATLAAEASATVRFEHHTDPAGDRTPFTYQLARPDGTVTDTTQLTDPGFSSYGPGPGTWVMQAQSAPGWRVAAINCVASNEANPGVESQQGILNVDVANGRVTINHALPGPDPTKNHHVCAFTHARIGASPSGSSGGTRGVAPTPIFGAGSAVRPATSAVSRVVGGTRSATATVRLAKRSIVKATLLNGRRTVGASRVVQNAGVYRVKVNVPRKEMRRLRAGGRTSRTLRMRVVIAEQGGATKVFNLGVRVRLT